jgi:predicted ATPase
MHKEESEMLNELQIKNYKAWKDTGKIRLAPLTVFFGSNSSGKSSISQFLLLLKQSAANSDRKAILVLQSDNGSVDLGQPKDIIYNHNTSLPLSFSYTWKLDKPFDKVDDIDTKNGFRANTIRFSAEIDITEKNTLEVQEFNYRLNDFDFGLKRTNTAGTRPFILENNGYDIKRMPGRAWNIGSPIHFYGFPDDAVAYHQNANFLQSLNLEQERFLSSISYLGPLRRKASRLYTWSGTDPESVGDDGINTIAAVLSAGRHDRKISLRYKSRRKPFNEIIAIELKKMGLIEDFNIRQISQDRQEYDVKVRIRGSQAEVDVPDVGFGVSQVLPVIVQLFYAQKNSIIIMEQPELHLHPSAQAGLADVMIDAIRSSEDGARNIQLIIETHSEHFLRRLQRRIAEGEISQDQFSAYFANNNTSPARLEALDVDAFGNILNWPGNFFGDISGDLLAQGNAIVEKRRAENAQ